MPPALRNLAVLLAGLALAAGGLAISQENQTGAAAPGAPSLETMMTKVTAHTPDAFYDPPSHLPDRHGTLLRSEPLEDAILPQGMRAWRILYETTVDDHTPATAVAVVFAPEAPSTTPLPVIAWTHGTTGILQKCMPSLVTAPAMGIPALRQAAAAGWVIVATDYQFAEKDGPHPYLIGEGEGRAALDAVRAARQLQGLRLDRRTVVWGHSQGGHSALWTGIIAQRYAPDVPILGIAAIAPAADMANIVRLNPAAEKRLGPYLALAYSRFYPDIAFNEVVRHEALTAAREMANLCGFLPASDPERINALAKTFEGPTLALDQSPAMTARLAQNKADRPITPPVLIVQGSADVVVLPTATDTWVKERCAAGQRIEYWTFAGYDHGTIVRPGTPLDAPLAEWTAARLAGRPTVTGCTHESF